MKHWGAPLGALLLAAAVAIGAFGAHGLRQQVDSGAMTARDLEIFQTGVFYHFVHGLGLLVAGLLVRRGVSKARGAGVLFLVGIVVFSGSLYALVLTGVRKFGMTNLQLPKVSPSTTTKIP